MNRDTQFKIVEDFNKSGGTTETNRLHIVLRDYGEMIQYVTRSRNELISKATPSFRDAYTFSDGPLTDHQLIAIIRADDSLYEELAHMLSVDGHMGLSHTPEMRKVMARVATPELVNRMLFHDFKTAYNLFVEGEIKTHTQLVIDHILNNQTAFTRETSSSLRAVRRDTPVGVRRQLLSANHRLIRMFIHPYDDDIRFVLNKNPDLLTEMVAPTDYEIRKHNDDLKTITRIPKTLANASPETRKAILAVEPKLLSTVPIQTEEDVKAALTSERFSGYINPYDINAVLYAVHQMTKELIELAITRNAYAVTSFMATFADPSIRVAALRKIKMPDQAEFRYDYEQFSEIRSYGTVAEQMVIAQNPQNKANNTQYLANDRILYSPLSASSYENLISLGLVENRDPWHSKGVVMLPSLYAEAYKPAGLWFDL